MHLALTDLFRAKWTDQIHDEWIRNVLEQRPDLRREQLHAPRRRHADQASSPRVPRQRRVPADGRQQPPLRAQVKTT